MKIAYCLPQVYKPGGIERIVSIKANWLIEHGYQVNIITACQKGKPAFYSFSDKTVFHDLNIDYDATLQLPIWKRILKKQKLQSVHKKKLTELLLQLKADIVISTFTHEADFLPDIKDGSKKILEFHFAKGHKRIMADSFHFSFLTKMVYYLKCWKEENLIVPKYDQFVVLTKEDKEQWKKSISNVINIPNILPFETSDKANLLNKNVIAVGRLDAQKGFDKLIKIWAYVYKECPDWKLNIYGDGKDKYFLNSLIKTYKLNNVITIHHPEQTIRERYLESSVFVMTSRYEGLPMTLLEAMGLGLPCVAYAFKCGPRDIIVNKKNGYIIPNNNENEFTKHLISLMKDDTQRLIMGNNAKKHLKQYYKKEIMPKWDQLFNKMITQ